MKNRPSIFIFALGFLLLGCYPDGPDYVEELDVVLTNFKDYDFQAKATYAMPDSIVKITGNKIEGEQPEFVSNAVAASILQVIASNMSQLGWERVGVGENPDLLLAPAAWETTTIFYWYDYWSWWWGGYYPYWPCCWSGYYPPAYVSSYTTGTLVMTLIDPKIVSATGRPISQWTSAINGLTTTYDPTRISQAIDQAFAQSPYLIIN